MEKLLVIDAVSIKEIISERRANTKNGKGDEKRDIVAYIGAVVDIIDFLKPHICTVVIEKSEEEPEAMYDYLSKALDFYGINKCIIDKSLIPGYIASIGDEYSKEYDITVFTADNMYFQLVKEHVSVIKFKNGMNVLYDDAHIRERFKVFPSQYADFITLVGDKKTGLCSIDKISAKAAMILLERYGSIEGILSNYEYIRKLPIRESIRENLEEIKRRYLELKITNKGSNVPFDLLSCRVEEIKLTTKEMLLAIGLGN